jgi:dihydropteroate synthase
LLKGKENLGKTTLNIRGRLIDLTTPLVMGIINTTPDSFYSESRASTQKAVLNKAEAMLLDGADILDIGGYSTRPGASDISITEEINRVVPQIAAITKTFPDILVSIDSFRSEVVEAAIDNGAKIINDISAGSDPKMFGVVADSKLPYIMMHMRGPVSKMMDNLVYDDLLVEMTKYFQDRIQKLTDMGVTDIIIDPGFGFSKSLDQNYEILRNLSYFEALEQPILVGVSRKSMIYKTLNTTPEKALLGTAVLNYAALEKGARILRVHDVKEAKETVTLFSKVQH